MTDICFTPARKLAQLIRSRKLSATEVMKAFIAQIERVNPKVNAIVTFLPEAALAAAKKFDRNFKANKAKPLAGLPIAYKDLVATKGIRTTLGLAGLHGQRAAGGSRSSSSASTAAGAITLGKTNPPEFAAGSHTFNLVFGATRNPYDLEQERRRLLGRRGRRGRLRHAALRRRLRPRRQPAQSGQLLQRGRLPARRRAACPTGPRPNAWDTQPVLGPIARTRGGRRVPACGDGGPRPRARRSRSPNRERSFPRP